MNVWRLGTSWGKTPILEKMLKSKVGFFGKCANGIREDDIIAISKPHTRIVVAIGIAETEIRPLTDLLTPDEQSGILSQWIDEANGFRFKEIWEIPEEKQFETADYKQFYNLGNDPEAWDNAVNLALFFKGEKKMKELCQLLQQCHNLILTGAPGTGKTHLAKEIAEVMVLGRIHDDEHPLTEEEKVKLSNQVGFCQFHPSYDYTDFVEGLRPAEQDDGSIGFQRQDGIFKKFCKSALETEEISDNFEEVYSKFKSECEEDECLEFYTEKLHKKFTVTFNSKLSCVATPQTGYGSKMQMKKEWFRDYLRNGVVRDWKPYLTVVAEYMREKYNYTKSVNKAYNNDSSNGGVEQPFVFIIDEINRGDIAKIFGELFFAIDPGYRGIKGRIKTQYNGLVDDDDCFKEGFYVPGNVYIIGTMNDIDRNVESMDFAIRRRFTWKEITPDENLSMWDNEKNGIPEYKDQARTTMEKINASIIDMAGDGLGPQYQLGAAYFLKLKEYDGDFNKLWDWHIAPLLHEYLRGTPEADKHFNNLRDVWFASLSPKQNLSAESSEQMAPK